jgi:squalene-hopene/tetraprenyl-beta-curcumene cyclase
MTLREAEKRCDRAIDLGIAHVRRHQRPDGAWEGTNDAGPSTTAIGLVAASILGGFTAAEVDGMRASLLDEQLPSGAFPGWAGDDGDLATTSLVVVGLRASARAQDEAAIRRAQAWLDARGGLGGLIPFAVPLAVMAGQLPVDRLGPFPHALRLHPGHGDWMARWFGLNTLVPFHTLAGMHAGLRLRGRPRWRHPVLARSADATIAYFDARQDPGGGWVGVAFITVLIALALRACGVPAEDPRIRRAIAWVRGHLTPRGAGLYLPPFRSTLWDTAQLVRALIACGVDQHDPMIARAVAHLLPFQTAGSSPWDWQTPPPGAPPDAGWPFQPGNGMNPDLDSSQEVMSALALTPDLPGAAEAADRCRRWLLAMQNGDGGWAAFSWGKPGHPGGPLHLLPASLPPSAGPWARASDAFGRAARLAGELGDPSAAGITGRMLWALGALGHDGDEDWARRARAFLAYHRVDAVGGWWGRWAVNYVPTTVYVTTGLARLGVGGDDPLMRSGLDFLGRVQRADGSWGDTPASYADASLAGTGPVVRSLTGCGLWALSTGGRADTDAARRAVGWLADAQDEDGGWTDTAVQGVLMPHVGYYRNETFSWYGVLEGLGAWRRAI